VPRPPKCRRIVDQPPATGFQPVGVSGDTQPAVELGLDELEALRLADCEGLYQDAAAERMGISRATFSRLVQTARTKVATALVEGRVLMFQGGTVRVAPTRRFMCETCGAAFDLPHGTGRPDKCPKCSSNNIFRADGPCGGRHRRGRCGRGCGPGANGPGRGRRN
jgi:predicted DNA-binding protein (UPF0251 family)